MKESSSKGIEARRQFRGLVAETEYEVHALSMNMNQMYTHPGSLTVVEDGDILPPFEGVDPELEQLCSTYPGFSLPHVWLTQIACGPILSTLDIVGKGRFTIQTGLGGQAWKHGKMRQQTWQRRAKSTWWRVVLDFIRTTMTLISKTAGQ